MSTYKWNFPTRNFILLAALAGILIPTAVCAQSSVEQTFASTSTTPGELTFTSSGNGGYFNPDGIAGSVGAYGVAKTNNGADVVTTTLTFATQTFAVSSGTTTNANKLTFQLANPISTFSDGSKVDVFINVNGVGFSTSPQLSIQGPGPTFKFTSPATSTSSYSYTYSNTPTTTLATMTAGASGYINMITVNLPSSTTSKTRVQVKIGLSAGTKGSQNTVLITNVTMSSGNSSPLPVELTYFDATAQANAVSLSWATAQEKNSDHFDVQRSASSEAFQTIGTVQGQGTSASAHDYRFSDSRPLAGRSYYRLRQIDSDGTSTFSPVATVQIQTNIAVYPNPSAGTIQLPATSGIVRYRVLNALGQSLLSGQAAGSDQLNLTALPKGVFFLELTSETGRNTQRLIHE